MCVSDRRGSGGGSCEEGGGAVTKIATSAPPAAAVMPSLSMSRTFRCQLLLQISLMALA